MQYKIKQVLILSLWFSAAPSFALIIGPTGGSGADGEYSQFSDSPFAAIDFSNGYFVLEDMEDMALPAGVMASSGGFVTDVFGPSAHDSVDEDDGAIDGNGLLGESWFAVGSTGVSFTFDQAVLGALPTHAGLVWTDGAGTISFEAFDQLGNSLGSATGSHADGLIGGNTSDDRFYGAQNAAGISSIFVSNVIGGIEIDHLQFGVAGVAPPPPVGNVPEPSTMLLLSLGLVSFARSRAKSILRWLVG